MLLQLIILAILNSGLSSEGSAVPAVYYTAAVVEYHTPLTPSLSGDQVLENNANKYAEFMKNASLQNADIIVFPEATLSRGNRNKMIEVPDPKNLETPCYLNGTYHKALVIISCAARDSKIYTVINLTEKYVNTTSNKTEYYNTNLAFDRNGTVVARYRKYNPYGEFVNKPLVPDHSILETDFGVKFGLFTCFDIQFYEPAIAMAKEYEIQHFIFPNCWISELPFLTALQMQWGWSYSLEVVLLAAGCNQPESGGSGSGIFHGKHGPLQYFQTNDQTSKMLIARVPTSINTTNTSVTQSNTTLRKKSEEEKQFISTSQLHHEEKLLEKTVESGNTSLWMLQDYMDVYHSIPLLSSLTSTDWSRDNMSITDTSATISLQTHTTICERDFCCDFKIKMKSEFSAVKPLSKVRGDDFSQAYYRLVLFDGVRWFGGGVATGGVQVCAVVACVNSSLTSCGLKADDPTRQLEVFIDQDRTFYRVKTEFQKISIIPTSFFYNNTFVFPDILVTGSGDGFGAPLPTQNFSYEAFEPYNYNMEAQLETLYSIDNLITAAVYARQFDRDGQPRTVPSSYNSHHSKSISLFVVLYLIVLKFMICSS